MLVDDAPSEKPGTRVAAASVVRLRGAERRFVSRGGEKLAGALEDLGLAPAGRVGLDLGASTGGFTDALLRAGAAHVVAVDVGYGQLHPRLRSDPRVTVRERTNARFLERAVLPLEPELAVIDVSFISATRLLARLPEVAPRAEVLVLVKPQFEVGPERVGRGGVVRDPAARADAVARVRAFAGERGYRPLGEVESRLPGPRGNREVFLWLRPSEADSAPGGEARTVSSGEGSRKDEDREDEDQGRDWS